MEMTEDERNGRDFREAETKGDKIDQNQSVQEYSLDIT